MRIVFNLYRVGLGNNGGSRTLIKCAETLQNLGKEVILYAPECKYTWHPIGVKVSKKCPKCDVMVATGYGSVKNTLQSKATKKFYYIRGFERWVTTKSNLLSSYRALNCIVNSEWLRKYLKKRNIHSTLIYPGLDFDDFYDEVRERSGIGAIFSRKHKTKRHKDAIEISKSIKENLSMLNKDIINPDVSKLRRFYNKIKVWISPSELEGLHNCPMEASLCGCGLVVTDHEKGGVSDYAIHKETALVYPARKLSIAIEYIRLLLEDDNLRISMNFRMKELLRIKIGDRITNMSKMLRLFKK